MSTLDDARPAGFALAMQAPTREAAEAVLGAGVEIREWEFGGRR